jgi:CRISPR/Cas system CMR subunit Cmr6 (Cas7 group RAMP superfamily)
MDFLISTGVEKVIRSTVQEIHAFEGLEAPLVQQVLQGQKFAHWLNVLFDTTKQIVKQNPEFMNDFERNVRKRLVIWIIKEVQKLADINLRLHFTL